MAEQLPLDSGGADTAEQRAQPDFDKIYLASGYAHPQLAEDTARAMGTELGSVKHDTFPNTETYVRFLESVRGKHVIIIQTGAAVEAPDGRQQSVNDAFVEAMWMSNAARGSSAEQITLVMPYFPYSRQDRRSKGREPISAQGVIDALVANGVNRFVSIDLHSPQTQAIHRGPFDHLTAQPKISKAAAEIMAENPNERYVVIAPDVGSVALSNYHRQARGLDLVTMWKMRQKDDSSQIIRESQVEGVEGAVCLVFDDMLDTGGTIISAAETLKNSKAKGIIVGVTHAILSGDAAKRIKDSPIDLLIATDTLPLDKAKEVLGDRLKVVSVAEMLAEGLTEIIINGSISKMFEGQNYK